MANSPIKDSQLPVKANPVVADKFAILDSNSGTNMLSTLDSVKNLITAALSGDKTFSQSFISATSVHVVHNLGKYPSVTVIDSANDECEGDVVHNSINDFTVTFSAAFSGKVFCN